MSLLHFTKENFDHEVMKSEIPVLVDFWAEWCGPCQMIGPIVDEIAHDLQGKLKVGKINVDNEQELAAQFSIMSIPTLLLLEKGEVIEQIVGAMSKEQLLKKINVKLL